MRACYRRYKDSSTDALKDENGDDQLFNKEVLDDAEHNTPVAVEDLVRRSEMVRTETEMGKMRASASAVPERADDLP